MTTAARSVEYACPGDAVFRAASAALASMKGFTLKSSDGRSGTLEGSVGTSFFSWGEEIRLTVREIAPSRTVVSISSTSRVSTTRWDNGKNRKNVGDLLEKIRGILDGEGPARARAAEQPAMSMNEKEGDEIRPLEDLLAKGKITQQEFEDARAKILAAKGSMPCPACGAKNPETARECFNCGGLLRGEQYVCPDCGAQLPSRDVAACPACGSKFAVQARAPVKVYAGFWARLGASLIDGLLVGIVVLLVSAFAAFFTAVPTTSPSEATGSFFTLTLFLAAGISWAYFAGQESSAAQATLGKRAIGAQVSDLEGKRITLARATGRWLAKFLSAAPLCLGFVLIGFTDRKQGLHDRIAGTLVRYCGKSE